MEADWASSFMVDDDYDQTYEYCIEEETAVESDIFSLDSKNYDSNIKTESSNKKKRKSNSGVCKHRKQSINGTEMYFQHILSWSPNDLVLNSREVLLLPPLKRSPSIFKNKYEYYDYLRQIPIEESRVNLTRGLVSPENTFKLRMLDTEFRSRGDLVCVMFEVLNISINEIKPGWVYCLIPCVLMKYVASKYYFPKSSTDLSPHLFCNEHNRYMYQMVEGVSHLPCFNCTLVQKKPGDIYSRSVTMWIHQSMFSSYQNSQIELPGFDWTFHAFGCANLISYQRMMVAAYEEPSPPFLNVLLGHKPPTHIIFGDECDDVEHVAHTQDSIPNSTIEECSSVADGTLMYDSDPISAYHLNTAQLSAKNVCTSTIRASLQGSGALPASSSSSSQCFHMVQGPPGTGKTTFLADLIYSLLREQNDGEEDITSVQSCGLKLLVTAPSNKAVSVLVEKLLSFEVIPNVSYCLIGVQDKIESCSSEHQYLPKRSIDSISHAVELETVNILCFYLRGDPCPSPCSSPCPWPHLAAPAQDADNSQCMLPLPLIPQSLGDLINGLIWPNKAADIFVYTCVDRIATVLLLLAGQFLFLSRLILDIHDNSISSIPSYKISFRLWNELECTIVNCMLNNLLNELDRVMTYIGTVYSSLYHKNRFDKRYDDILELLDEVNIKAIAKWKIQKKSSLDAISAQSQLPMESEVAMGGGGDSLELLQLLQDEFTQLSNIILDSTNISQIWLDQLNSANVVFCTLSSSSCTLMKQFIKKKNSFDVVFIDESGQALETELLVSLSCLPKCMILVGDPKQLSATILSNEALKYHMNVSTMQRLFEVAAYDHSILHVQYRMHPEIVSFPNKHFYEGKLTSFVNAGSVCLSSDMMCDIGGGISSIFESQMCWFDHYKFIDIISRESGNNGSSKYNQGQAKIIAK